MTVASSIQIRAIQHPKDSRRQLGAEALNVELNTLAGMFHMLT
jgi:hypothetical protein